MKMIKVTLGIVNERVNTVALHRIYEYEQQRNY